MAQTRLVKDQAQEGQRLIEHLQKNHFNVAAACWLLDSERDDWVLFIVSGARDEKERLEGREVLRAAFQEIPDLWMDWTDVRLIDPTDRVAQEIAAIQRRYPVRLKNRHHIRLGGMSSADVHIYPLPVLP